MKLRKMRKRLAVRQARFDNIPAHLREGMTRPGSMKHAGKS